MNVPQSSTVESSNKEPGETRDPLELIHHIKWQQLIRSFDRLHFSWIALTVRRVHNQADEHIQRNCQNVEWNIQKECSKTAFILYPHIYLHHFHFNEDTIKFQDVF